MKGIAKMTVQVLVTLEAEFDKQPGQFCPAPDAVRNAACEAVRNAMRRADDWGYDHPLEECICFTPSDVSVYLGDDSAPERCDECGASYPLDATDLIGTWHRKTCSLHPKNIV
jgi:hypothetical protein